MGKSPASHEWHPVNLLAIDTSTQQGVVALVGSTGKRRVVHPEAAARHGRALLPAIREVLDEAGLRVHDLDGLAVGLGPGSYTGIRIGLTAARILAYAGGKPLAGLDSLELFARTAPPRALRVSAIATAQRNDLYVRVFGRSLEGARLVPLGPTRIEPLRDWLDRLVPGTYLAGPALALPGVDWPAGVERSDSGSANPDGSALLDMTIEAFEAGRAGDPALLEPHYLRRSAAEDKWDERGRAPAPASRP